MTRGGGRRRWLAAVCALLAACADRAAIDSQQEIAAELRSLRIALQEAQRPAAPAVSAAVDAAAFADVLEPMREVLTALVRDMADMQTRQAALTQELQRWSQLLAQSVTEGQQAEAKALAARLQELEATMRQQDARHREVEAMIGGALERTSERLEDFLKRLEAVGGPAGGEPKATGTGGSEPSGEAAGPEKQVQAEPRPRRGGSTDSSLWWFGTGAAALLAGGMFAFWLRRENAAGVALVRAGEDGRSADEGADELWAAAALLGEAVGRLRQNGGESAGEDFVVEEDEQVPQMDLPGPPPPAPVPGGPPRISLRCPASDAGRAVAAVQAALASDPRVLRRPAPQVVPAAGQVEVTFAVLPDLAPGERGHLEQMVRDAAR